MGGILLFPFLLLTSCTAEQMAHQRETDRANYGNVRYAVSRCGTESNPYTGPYTDPKNQILQNSFIRACLHTLGVYELDKDFQPPPVTHCETKPDYMGGFTTDCR